MKRFLSIILSFVLTFSFPVATSASTNVETSTKTENGYTFEETISSDYSINRTYHNTMPNTRTTPTKDETIALLTTLGMPESMLEAMPDDTLQEFATAKDIFVTSSYTKHNEDSNITIGLPETVAIEESTALNKLQMEYILNPESASTYGNMPSDTQTPGEFKDSYMKITHAAAHQGGGKYKYVTNAEWLTMPFFRGFDSIGSCAKGNGSATPYSAKGTYSYTTITIANGSTGYQPSGNISISKVQDKTNGDWYGYAGIFDLPEDVNSPEIGLHISHTNLKAYFEYSGNVANPQLVTNFNTNATYSHSTIAITFDPSVSIDTSGVHASIGLKLIGSTDDRIAPLEVKYVP